jgi:hypothetical protein
VFVNLELKAGRNHEPTKEDMQKNINAMNILLSDYKLKGNLDVLVMDTRSILEGIQRLLPTNHKE